MTDIKRDFRYNTSNGRAHEAPNVKESGTATVARVMGGERGHNPNTPNHAQKFEFEAGNRAKKINHDAYPK